MKPVRVDLIFFFYRSLWSCTTMGIELTWVCTSHPVTCIVLFTAASHRHPPYISKPSSPSSTTILQLVLSLVINPNTLLIVYFVIHIIYLFVDFHDHDRCVLCDIHCFRFHIHKLMFLLIAMNRDMISRRWPNSGLLEFLSSS